MNIFKKRQSKLSRRITWRVILIVTFINVLIIGAILLFVFIISTMISGMRASSAIDGINGKRRGHGIRSRQFELRHFGLHLCRAKGQNSKKAKRL